MLPRALLLLVVVLVTLGAGSWWRSRQGRVRAVGTRASSAADPLGASAAAPPSTRSTGSTAVPAPASATAVSAAASWREHGVELADRGTFVQFSTTFCSPCRATSRSLRDVTAGQDGIGHVELDLGEHPALVRELSVLRAPTVVLLDAHGTQLARMSGALSAKQAREALDLVPAP